MSEEDVPNLNVIFTSETNAYGIINSAWVEGNQYSLSIDLKKKLGMVSNKMSIITFFGHKICYFSPKNFNGSYLESSSEF